MLISMPTAMPASLMGPLGAAKADIENLQRALQNLSQATQRPDINVPTVTGVVDGPTVTAVTAALGLLTQELPSWAYLALQAGLVAGSATNIAKEAVGNYATQLTIAANTAALKFKKPVVAPPAPAAFPGAGFFAPGWYKTPVGIGILALGALVIYKLFLSSPSSSK